MNKKSIVVLFSICIMLGIVQVSFAQQSPAVNKDKELYNSIVANLEEADTVGAITYVI